MPHQLTTPWQDQLANHRVHLQAHPPCKGNDKSLSMLFKQAQVSEIPFTPKLAHPVHQTQHANLGAMCVLNRKVAMRDKWRQQPMRWAQPASKTCKGSF